LQPVAHRVHLIVNGEETSQIGPMTEMPSSSPLKTALIPIGESHPEVQVDSERWNQTQSKTNRHATTAKAPSVRTVLEEVFELLEDYAPIWYTEEQHDRILAALHNRDQ
jgi:hypothetical protein